MIEKQKQKQGKNDAISYLKNETAHSFFITPTTEEEVIDIIKSLNDKKATDIYGFSVKLIKIALPVIANILSYIFNNSFLQGIFPDKLKYASITPIHKGGSKLSLNNYRPISILPLFSKVLEKIMQERLVSYLNKYNIIYEHQYGFQKNKSTSLAIMDMYSKLINAIEKKQFSCGVFLDFAKAFDTVNHKILIKKIEHYGIRGITNEWFKSYLLNRYQKVKIGNTLSDECHIECGVPQGSVLGPILFLLYINDIQNSSNILKFHLFADDTSTIYSNNELKNIQEVYNKELIKVSEWLTANKLTLNILKSNVVIFHPKYKKINEKIEIKINQKTIKENNYAKYLGVLIDKNLTWNEHIQSINFKISKGNGILYKLRDFVSKQILRTLYYSFIQPYIDYGLLNWGSAPKSYLEIIRKNLNKTIRIMSFKGKYESTKELFENFKILDFDSNHKYKIGTFMYKLNNNLLPIKISNMFHKLNTGKENVTSGYLLPSVKTNFGKRFITFTGISNWKKIPKNIKEKGTLKLFSKYYKKHIMENK